MGFLVGNPNIITCLEARQGNGVDCQIKIYDQFIERQMGTTQLEETQKFLIPIWRLRSNFNDALRPVEESMADSDKYREKMIIATDAIRAGRIHDHHVIEMMVETRKCYKTYEEYLRRLKELYTRTKYIFNTISYHKIDILDEYAETQNFNPIAIRHHYNRIVFVLEMSLIIGESILDAMKNAKSVVKCARENLETITDCYKKIVQLKRSEAEKALIRSLPSIFRDCLPRSSHQSLKTITTSNDEDSVNTIDPELSSENSHNNNNSIAVQEDHGATSSTAKELHNDSPTEKRMTTKELPNNPPAGKLLRIPMKNSSSTIKMAPLLNKI